jgi:hypothetical protein
MVLLLEDIRSIAKEDNYQEISLNESSRVISFRGGPSSSARINVYYTTGTIATCLNHPKRGKTQLFRRNVTTLDALQQIFENPRVHTGDGYYYQRQNIRQQWKEQGTNNNDNEFLRDSALRWMHVGTATGLLKNQNEMGLVEEICTRWDDLYWNKDDLPDIKDTNYACGSHGGLIKMLYEVIQEGWGDFHTCRYCDVSQNREDGIRFEDVDTERPYDHECANFHAFCKDHAVDVLEIKHKFLSLKKDLRLELAQWFLSRDVTGYCFADPDLNKLETKYSSAVTGAHIDYGELMYPKKARMCYHCGVLLEGE